MFFNCGAQSLPLDSSEDQYALHVGLEHRFNNVVLGVRPRRARVPHAERRGASVFGSGVRCVFFNPIPGNFQLKTQTSHDVEGGFRIKSGGFQMQSSIYNMDLENEIHFIPALFFNVNLDPTRRYGSETSASLRVSDSVLLRGGVAYTRAVFREGQFAGNDVPLVSRYTASGGVTWNIWQNYLVCGRHGARLERALHGQRPGQYPAPHPGRCHGRFQAERRISSTSSGRSSVNNVLNALYYDYAIASTFTPGRFAAYPLPGRTYMVKAGATF